MKSRRRKKASSKRKFSNIRLSLGLLSFFLLVLFIIHPKIVTSNEERITPATEHISSNIALPITPLLLPTSTPVPATPTPTPDKNTPPAHTFCINVPIVLYHHIEPYELATKAGHQSLTVDSGFFDQQMSYLQSAGYHSLTLDQLVQAIQTHQQVPAKSIVVTLDDGYSDNFTYAYPIMKKYGIVGNFAIATGLLENAGYMTVSQVKELAQNGMGIYNHTWSHASLGGASKEKIQQEIKTAGNTIAEITGKKSTILIYPYGSYSPQAMQVLKENGYVAALTTINGSWQCESNIMTLYRTHIGNAPLRSYGF